MTNFEYIKTLSLEELAEWLDKNGSFDDSPWLNSFNEKYCSKCESIEVTYEDSINKLGLEPLFYDCTTECTYCELENKCQFFSELDDVPDNKEMIKLWLIEEVTNE